MNSANLFVCFIALLTLNCIVVSSKSSVASKLKQSSNADEQAKILARQIGDAPCQCPTCEPCKRYRNCPKCSSNGKCPQCPVIRCSACDFEAVKQFRTSKHAKEMCKCPSCKPCPPNLRCQKCNFPAQCPEVNSCPIQKCPKCSKQICVFEQNCPAPKCHCKLCEHRLCKQKISCKCSYIDEYKRRILVPVKEVEL